MRHLKRLASDLPAPAKSAAQALVSSVDPLLVRRYRRRHGVDEPIPPVALRARVGNPEIGPYLASGGDYIALVREVLASHGGDMADFKDALDFGCGCGRVLVPFWEQWGQNTRFHGCDIDEGAIAWLRRHYPEIAVKVNGFHPPLPYEAASFDLIYSVSVFTHLDEAGQDSWLAEIRRVLRPGGLALATIHGKRAFRDFAQGEAVGAIRRAPERIAAHSLDQAGFAYEAGERSRWNALRFIEDGTGWGLAFHSADYVRQRWGEIFPSVEILDGKGRQDVVLLRA